MRHRIELTAPAADFHDGFPIGNGRLGAMVHGRCGTEWFDLNADTLWSGGPLAPPPGPSPAGALPPLRAAIAAGDHARADALARSLQGPAWTQSYQPLGRLTLAYGSAGSASTDGYRRWLDLARAVAVTRHGGAEVTSFVSAPDDVLVVSVAAPGAPELHSPHPGVTLGELDGCLVWTGQAPESVLPNYVVDRSPAVTYGPAGMGFAVAAAVDGDRLLVAAATGFRGPFESPSTDLSELALDAVARVSAARRLSTAELLERHVEEHRGWFGRADLHLPDAPREELLFHLGRYLLVAASRPGTQPANLQGIWNADVRPGWSSNWTTNINAQMNYWAAETTGLAELHEPLLTLTRDLAVAGAPTAAFHYGAGGAAAHHNTDLWRFTAPVPGEPQWANWPSALAWLSAHLWEHWSFGGEPPDPAVFAAAARFTLDLLVPDASGALVLSPSTSPEHDFSGGTAVSWGCAMDQELAREVLTRCAALGGPLAAEASRALELLRPVQTGPDGALLEWYDDRPPGEPGHRHLSHLYGLYPGTRITETGTPADYAAARLALHQRLAAGTGHTGWSRAWVLCLAARLRDAPLAASSLRALLDELCSPSLLTLHPDAARPTGWIFQIDGNLGAAAGIAELLVQSHEGTVALLKTLPPAWSSGSARGLRCRGGHEVALSWAGGALREARIVAGRNGPLVADLPPGPLTVPGATAAPGAAPGRRRLTWDATAGTEYVLTAS
ncbi:glycoside hydrolase N-terminal domain-containing protein [Dactylosporangium sucinum]|uniref:Alpha/beta hydrolase n=1 Tax=Dactylosporangium sucinum TaxID=1424081 RepID=A0A917WI72_9ACTN|nr:glycoside hydrolase N-terminal domain-containing protein [Dactylosporangium sucinum]GGM05170.1 alpha/beta hydrolase [Dactylosporangium sucinum]